VKKAMTQRRKIKRSRLVPAGAVALFALLLFPLSSVAQAGSGNLLPNGSFQSGTSGWTTTDATFTIASDGAGDSFAGRLALSTTATSYVLTASPRPVLNTTAGVVYTANGVVRSDTPGKKVCPVLKELTSGGALVSTSSTCTTTTSQWAPLAQVTLTAQNSGGQIAFVVRQSNAVAGDSFEVDTLSLVASGSGGGGGSPPSTPTNVGASAASSTQINVSWNQSTDPDPSGVAGYAIYRDGGGTAIGTAPGGSTTAYSDTSVLAGTTHYYTVAAYDPEGNYSPQSAPSNSVTTPQPSVVGLWHLDETNGTTAHDSSGNGHDGAINGTVTLGVPGVSGSTAYSFVPKSNVIVPDAPDLRPGTANVTISYWLNATTPPAKGDYDIFVKGQSGSSGGQIKIEVQQNGQASCAFGGALGTKQLQAGPNVIDGQWHKVICQRVGNQIIETVDGQTFSVTKATGAITVTDPIRLGAHEGAAPLRGSDWYNGVLDEVTYTIG
jgi:hypothetical protein